ncbi:MAG: cell wall-binding repeat-containing protein [Herbiconiux sp.]|nr:cell wall-binding repeat-containing protein [Herbiconiux sp.]
MDDSYVADVGAVLTVAAPGVLANDEATGLSWTVIKQPEFGTLDYLVFDPAVLGSFTYKSIPGRPVTSDSFTYCLSRLIGSGCVSNTATVTITFREATAVDDQYSLGASPSLLVPPPGMLANDVNASSLSNTVLSYPHDGALTRFLDSPSGGFEYVPRPGFTGLDTFTYCLSFLRGMCLSEPATVTVRVGGPKVTRVEGSDRYSGAAAVAAMTHPSGARTVYLASGENYPDALSAGPAAVHEGAALLLVQRDSVPPATSKALTALAPTRVVVVGGPASISEATVAGIKTMVPGVAVQRVSGPDRYAVSRALAIQVFGTAAMTLVATGANFPDALSAGAAAGHAGAPVILVAGSMPSADADTLQVFRSLKTTSIRLVGGPNSLSPGLEASLRTVASLTRSAGIDRYAASVQVNQDVFAAAKTAYLATGLNYPDALVGSVAAGQSHSPLYVVPGTCIPKSTLAEFARLGVENVVLLGGPNSLSKEVYDLNACV